MEETIEDDARYRQQSFLDAIYGATMHITVLAVYATAILLGADRDEVLVKMSLLKAVAGRLEYVRE